MILLPSQFSTTRRLGVGGQYFYYDIKSDEEHLPACFGRVLRRDLLPEACALIGAHSVLIYIVIGLFFVASHVLSNLF